MKIVDFFKSENIDTFSILPFSEAEIIPSSRKSVEGIKTVVPFLIPYLVKEESVSNISRYARPRDYHLFIKGFEKRLRESCGDDFFVFADTSPVNEVALAVKSGLGNIGKNGLLLNRKYGSFVFIGTVFSYRDTSDEAFSGIERLKSGKSCMGCLACVRACPTSAISDKSRCISHINQKKNITPEEEAIIKRSGLVWGCDVCQDVCPVNRVAKETIIPFFREERITVLDEKTLDSLLERGTFEERAFAWRGEKPVRRNIKIQDMKNEK